MTELALAPRAGSSESYSKIFSTITVLLVAWGVELWVPQAKVTMTTIANKATDDRLRPVVLMWEPPINFDVLSRHPQTHDVSQIFHALYSDPAGLSRLPWNGV